MARTKALREWQNGGDRPMKFDDEGTLDEREPTADVDPIIPPLVLAVILTCPNCDVQTLIAAKLQTRVTKDSDGTGALALRVRAPKTQHVCGQANLGLVEGARER